MRRSVTMKVRDALLCMPPLFLSATVVISDLSTASGATLIFTSTDATAVYTGGNSGEQSVNW